HLDAAGAIVDRNLHVGQLALVAPRPLDGFDRDLVARSAADDDFAGDVVQAEAAVAADLHLAREALGLLRAVVAPLVGAGLDGGHHLAHDLAGHVAHHDPVAVVL